MTGRDLDLVVIGDVNPDVVVRDAEPAFGQHEEIVSSIELTIGGSASIMATAAARLGLRVALIGVVGDDPLGRFMLAELAARDVDVDACRVDRRMPTGATVIIEGETGTGKDVVARSIHKISPRKEKPPRGILRAPRWPSSCPAAARVTIAMGG